MRRRGAFDDEEDDFEQQKFNRISGPSAGSKSGIAAEFTLGAGTVLLLFAGLVVVCGVCFGFGYIVGHRGATSAASQQLVSSPTAVQASSTQQKPSATSQAVAPPPTQPAPQPNSAAPPPVNALPQSAVVLNVPASSAQSAAQPQVRPALPAPAVESQPLSAYPSHPANGAAQPQVRPAPISSAAQIWVQIAAVSHVEDAQVLTDALKRRGYIVTPRRDADNLIHVRIGPFTTREEADRWRSKLLNDGYNAEVQP